MISARYSSASAAAERQVARFSRELGRSTERLATGERINRAADDPSGLIASELLGSRIAAIEGELKGRELSQFRLSARAGAEQAIADLLAELEPLAVAAANRGATSREELEGLQLEVDGIVAGIQHVLGTTRFGGELLFTDSAASRYGLDEIVSGGRFNLIDGEAGAQDIIRNASASATRSLASIGAEQRYAHESTVDVLSAELIEVSAARSFIRDTDFAKEVSEMVRAQALKEAATVSLLISRDHSRSLILSLLR
ncbi:MAG: flagellin [Planctomycetota bacterium]|nr:flagellin [Planctomycetota bacterium]